MRVQIYKTKNFQRWAVKESVLDTDLIEAILQANTGLIEGDLGGGLIKKRVARAGAGKRSGHRTLIAFRKSEKAFFVFGFSKNDRANIDTDEKTLYRELAKYYLALDDKQIRSLLAEKKLFEVLYEED